MFEIITHGPEDTEEFGSRVAVSLKKINNVKFFIALYGDLGAGKTAFVRGLASVLSPGSRVKSPTYTIVNEYRKGSTPLFHFDFYRIENEDELDAIGFDEYLASGNCVGEWSEHLGARLPSDAVVIKIEKIGECDRRIIVDGIESEVFE